MKIGVHLHLYYLDQWDFFKEQLEYIGGRHGYDKILMITTSKEKKEEVRKIINGYPCNLFGLENRGYDVAPFIFALNKLKKWKPDVVLKLQTKGNKGIKKKLNLNGLIYKNAFEWRTRQVKGLLGNKSNTKKIINKFKKSEIGIVGNYEFLHYYFEVKRKKFDKFHKFFKKVSIKKRKKAFFAGTMFWIRWEIAEYLIKKIKFKDFDFVNPKTFGTTKECDTMAHAFEHGINSIVDYLGFETAIIDYTLQKRLFVFWRKYNLYSVFYKIFKRILKFVYYKKITNHNKILIKFCKIPIFYKSVKMEH